MFGYLKARRAERSARRQYELARIESMIAANRARMEENRRWREGPCQACVDAGITEPASAPTT